MGAANLLVHVVRRRSHQHDGGSTDNAFRGSCLEHQVRVAQPRIAVVKADFAKSFIVCRNRVRLALRYTLSGLDSNAHSSLTAGLGRFEF